MQALTRFLSRWSPKLAHRALLTGQDAFESGDYESAAEAFLYLAERGNVVAQFNIGVMYHDGKGVHADDKQAVKWLRLAAEQGFADAQFNLAVMYTQGYGVDRDDNEAAKWLRFAARQGNADAQFNLGILYRNGWGVVPDERQVGWWLSLAADQGHVEAQFKLGVMYLQGKFDPDGVALGDNLIRAHLCLNLAATSGNADAAKAREIVARNMTPEEVTEAQRLAQEWKPKTRDQSALEIYETDVEEFFQSLKAGPSEVAPTDMLKLLDRADDLIDVGVSLGEPAGNQLKTLRAVHHALATGLEKGVPETKDSLATINALKESLRSPGLRPWLKRPK